MQREHLKDLIDYFILIDGKEEEEENEESFEGSLISDRSNDSCISCIYMKL